MDLTEDMLPLHLEVQEADLVQELLILEHLVQLVREIKAGILVAQLADLVVAVELLLLATMVVQVMALEVMEVLD
jgi:hypothetical protein